VRVDRKDACMLLIDVIASRADLLVMLCLWINEMHKL